MPSKKFLTSLDLNKNELQNAVIQNLASTPLDPKEGQVYYNTGDKKFYIYQNGSFVSHVSEAALQSALAGKADKASTLAGYGISDAYTKSEVDGKIQAKDSLPSQEGNQGKFLSTNGTNAAWEALPDASSIAKGIVKISSDGELSTGTSTTVVPNVKQLTDELAKKQNTLTFDETPTSDSSNPVKSSGVFTALSNKADKSTSLAGYGINDAYTKSEIDSKISSVYKYKGSVANEGALPSSEQQVGDVYNVEDTGANFAWDGSKWDNLGATVDLSSYLTKDEAGSTYLTQTSASSTYETKENVESIRSDLQGKIDTLTSGSVHKHTAENELLSSSGGVATWTISHTMGSDVTVVIKEVSTGAEVFADISQTENTVTVKFNSDTEVQANTYKAIIIG